MRISSIVVQATESELESLGSVIDPDAELVGSDKIEKDILELNVMAVDAVQEGVDAYKQAVRDAKTLDDIGKELSRENERLSPFAAKMVYDRIAQLAQPYGLKTNGFSRESYSRDEINDQLAEQAQIACEGIIDMLKSAWDAIANKAKEIKNRLMKNIEYLSTRIEQIRLKASEAGDKIDHDFSYKSITNNPVNAISELMVYAKADAVFSEINAAVTKLHKVKDPNELGSVKAHKNKTIARPGRTLSSFDDRDIVFVYNQNGYLLGKENNASSDKGNYTQSKNLTKKQIIELMNNCAKVINLYKPIEEKFDAIFKSTGELPDELDKKFSETGKDKLGMLSREVVFGPLLAVYFASVQIDYVVRKVILDATNFAESSIKASR